MGKFVGCRWPYTSHNTTRSRVVLSTESFWFALMCFALRVDARMGQRECMLAMCVVASSPRSNQLPPRMDVFIGAAPHSVAACRTPLSAAWSALRMAGSVRCGTHAWKNTSANSSPGRCMAAWVHVLRSLWASAGDVAEVCVALALVPRSPCVSHNGKPSPRRGLRRATLQWAPPFITSPGSAQSFDPFV